jgi:hypothetical protein
MIELFNPEEWEQISQIPFLVFKYTAGIDGKVDSKEIAAFIQFCNNRKKFSSALIKEVLPENPEEYLKANESLILSKPTIKEKLKSVDSILDFKADVSDAISFKHHMIALGAYIANASGKIFGNKISEEEEDALMTLGNYIDIDVNLLFRSTLVDEILKKIN